MTRVHALACLVAVACVPASAGAGTATPPAQVVTVASSFAPDQVTVHVGDLLELTNLDVDPHNVTSTATGRGGAPLFRSDTVDVGAVSEPVVGVAALAPGSYTFVCSVHPKMRGILDVVPR